MIIGLCDRFHVLPSQVRGEDVELLRLLKIAQLGRRPEPEADGG